jgi:hypothetical protein
VIVNFRNPADITSNLTIKAKKLTDNDTQMEAIMVSYRIKVED